MLIFKTVLDIFYNQSYSFFPFLAGEAFFDDLLEDLL